MPLHTHRNALRGKRVVVCVSRPGVYSRSKPLRVRAFFGFGGGSAGGTNEDVAAQAKQIGKRFGGPSESGNEAVEALAASTGRKNCNPKSPAFYGTWKIQYASGLSGLTALDGRIATFKVNSSGDYVNECTARAFGVIPGSVCEGGKLRALGGGRYELVQQYIERRGVGGDSYSEVEAPTLRTFEMLYLDNATLIIRLFSTRYVDEDSGRPVTVKPDAPYYLLWSKVSDDADVRDDAPPVAVQQPAAEEEEEEGGLFSVLGTAIVGRKPGLATIAERGAQEKAGRRATPADDRKAAAEERRRAAAEAAERRRQEAEERRKARAAAQEESDGTAVVSKPFALGGLFGGRAAEKEPEGVDPREARRQAEAQRKADLARQREEAAAAKQAGQEEKARKTERVSELQDALKERSAVVKELSSQLKMMERENRALAKDSSAAQRKLDGYEATFERAEAELADANEAFNAIASTMREKQGELKEAEKDLKVIEGDMVKF